MSTGDWIALGGDILVFFGLVVTIVVYLRQSADSFEQLRQSDLAILRAARDGVNSWASVYFGKGYDKEATDEKAEYTYKLVRDNEYPAGMYLCVPTEPLTSVLLQAGEGRLIDAAAIAKVNLVLYHMGLYNQMVEEQNVFYGTHAIEIMGMASDDERRVVIAKYADAKSRLLHDKIIGNAKWYTEFITAFDQNIENLNKMGHQGWWQQLRRLFPKRSQ